MINEYVEVLENHLLVARGFFKGLSNESGEVIINLIYNGGSKVTSFDDISEFYYDTRGLTFYCKKGNKIEVVKVRKD